MIYKVEITNRLTGNTWSRRFWSKTKAINYACSYYNIMGLFIKGPGKNWVVSVGQVRAAPTDPSTLNTISESGASNV